MNRRWFRWWWLALLVPIIAGLARLHFDVEVLDLLPPTIPAVRGLQLYQQHFASARELIVTVRGPDRERTESVAASIAKQLEGETNLVADAIWQPPWLEHPGQMAELIAYLWLNQPPDLFAGLAARLSETNLAAVLASTRDELATTLSPDAIAQLSYDPFGLTRLPESLAGAVSGFGRGQQLFASADGTFRILFVKARGTLEGYRECAQWLDAVKQRVGAAVPPSSEIEIGYTGRPAFVADISASMKRDIELSVGGTSVIIAMLFWIAHRRIKPVLWLLTLLALILAVTLALGGLIFGAINVISMGFAAILLGLAVDYAVVHYQEALAHPDRSIPAIRRAIAPSILWAAVTTISAFLVLNLGGLPGLAQLGSLVGIGVAVSAFVMIFAFLPPLFPDRMRPQPDRAAPGSDAPSAAPPGRMRVTGTFVLTALLILLCVGILSSGLPKLDASASALQPRDSQAYATLEAIKANLGQKREPLWLIMPGRSEGDVAKTLDAVLPVLTAAVSNQTLSGFLLPDALWPRPDRQSANRANARQLAAGLEPMRAAAAAAGFSGDALRLAEDVLATWRRAAATPEVFWPTNPLGTWILEKLAAREPQAFYAVGFLYPSARAASFTPLGAQLQRDGAWLSGWELLGESVLGAVKANLWKLLLPMAGLILLSLGLAFRRLAEVCFSIGILLLSGLCLLAVMTLCGWQWNLLNLMALPLILGTGVDYSIFMQLALRRCHGNLQLAHRSVGRALLLCGGTAIAGFGSLGLSSNAGMSSLGRVCAVGIGGNMLISVFLLPVWWRAFGLEPVAQKSADAVPPLNPPPPSALYGGRLWRIGIALTRMLPEAVAGRLARWSAALYWRLAAQRRETVIQNLLPVLKDREPAVRAARELFTEFTLKLADLWRHESGAAFNRWPGDWNGWERFTAAHARGRGVLLVTPHLGNWEFGGALVAERGYPLLVLTQPEPDPRLAELRRRSRARRGIETLVVGEDAFAFVDIIRRLQEGVTVALLVDRPPAPTAVTIELFGKPFAASIAAAELARASGCAIVPAYIVHQAGGYLAHILPEITYDRAAIGSREARVRLTQEILRAFEPVIRQHPSQWFHFVPIWPDDTPK